jgi:NAD-dependent dihydropyrimidine dehydrogenase PreA subunit
MSGTATNLFIDIEVTPSVVEDRELAAKLTEVCPVDIYAQAEDGTLRVVDENLDECVLCRLCIDASPPGAVTVRRLYDGGAPL